MLGPTLGVRFTEVSRFIESQMGSKERQGPTQGVRFTDVSVKRESTVHCVSQTVLSMILLGRQTVDINRKVQ